MLDLKRGDRVVLTRESVGVEAGLTGTYLLTSEFTQRVYIELDSVDEIVEVEREALRKVDE